MMEFDQSAEILLFRSIDHPKGERNKDFGGKATDVSAKLHSGFSIDLSEAILSTGRMLRPDDPSRSPFFFAVKIGNEDVACVSQRCWS